jgi:NAD(P)-dependent dehydrogenase (short-subunit alcohol dehydrogenase family)
MPTVFITGANRGLGLEFARQYTADGWRVIATARDPGRAGDLKRLKEVEVHPLDVTDLAAVKALSRRLAGEAIDVLIANAGISGPREMRPEAIDETGWLETFRVNTIAPLAVAGAFRAQVARSSERKVVAVSSILGSIGDNDDGGLYAYRSAKAALNAVWRSFAIDHRELIAVVVHPGWVRTDMGGAAATLSPSESISGLRRVIADLKPADSGSFFEYSGRTLPW